MALDITAVSAGPVAEITLIGDLDASVFTRFQQELEGVAAHKPKHLVLRVGGLVFLASIGIRGLLKFTKMAPGTTIYVIAPQKGVLETLDRTGMLKSVVVQAEYPPAG